ncbi:glucosamine-6-phosphate deaminase [Vagococcus sp.]|uniref:glucosamine-6-phosphate deaminase n=1 Tax=Vagococcus sp. TaxID=1933889 RepID=UPI003F9C1176
MKIIIVKDQNVGGKEAFKLVEQEVDVGKLKTFGLATGSTPVTLYQELVNSSLDFSQINSVNLDEYIGLSAEHPQSYHHFMKEHLFEAKPFKQNFLPNGLAKDLEEECSRYDKIIQDHPIDFQILGIGENGHIGFNEPGASFEGKTAVVDLTDSTIQANSRNFEKIEDVPTQAISMGIKSIMASKKIILLAYGQKKAQAILETVEGEVTEEVPASILQTHSDVTLVIDEAAASLLTK